MVFSLDMLNSDAMLNNFFSIGTATFYKGKPITLVMRILQPQKSNLRYVLDSGATLSVTLNKSDGTTITKTPTFLDAGDRSLVKLELDSTDTELLIGQAIVLDITEGANQHVAVLQSAIQAAAIKDC